MEEAYTIKELAAKAGVPWQTVAAWKRSGKIPPEAVTTDGHFLKSVIDPLLESGVFQNSPPEPRPQKCVARTAKKDSDDSTFEEFARMYWQEGSKAVDVLLMPTETSTLLINHVNDALRFAWEKLQ